MTFDVYRKPESGEYLIQPTGEPHPDGWVLEVVTANPEYLRNEGLPHDEQSGGEPQAGQE